MKNSNGDGVEFDGTVCVIGTSKKPMDLFFKQETDREKLRKRQQELKNANRELTRDRLELERQEKKIEMEIKRAAKSNNPVLAKQLARQLIKLRESKSRNLKASSQITGIGHRQTALHSQVAVSKAMNTGVKAMSSANKSLNIEKLYKQTNDFQKQTMLMDTSEEMMNDTLDQLLGESDEEAEGEEIMSQILDEIGIEFGQSLANAPKNSLPKEEIVETEELANRLSKLKN
ncbi:Charged multivesicular body protein 2b [Nowakowskiella sp. JEL0407]|nr:Charged multivesicular body protein 2b [Nowakowskiella sp. JEL0407]